MCTNPHTPIAPAGDYSRWAATSYSCGRPFVLAWVWWRYVLTGLLAIVLQGMSRLKLFIWEWKAYGEGDWWYQGEGIWCWKYEHVHAITQEPQERKSAFACFSACMPDIFPTNILIFLPNVRPTDAAGAPIPDQSVQDSEWW